MNTLQKLRLAVAVLFLTGISPLSAANFTWNSGAAADWSNDANWNEGVPSGDDAVITTPSGYGTLQVDGNYSVDKFDMALTSQWEIVGTVSSASLSIDNLTKTGSGLLRFRRGGTGTTLSLTIGEVNVNGGTLQLGQHNSTTGLESLTVTGKTTIASGSVLAVNAKNASFSEVELKSGTATSLSVYAYNYSGATSSGGITVRGLTGGGQIYTITTVTNSNITGTLTIEGESGDSFSSNSKLIDRTAGTNGTNGTVTLNLVKTGQGVQKLTNNNTYSGTTGIDGGTLVVNGTHTGGAQYTVSGNGILAGTGTIITANADVVIKDNGKLSAGDAGTGSLTLALGTGKLDLTQAGGGALAFTLDSTTTSTSVSLTSGAINIGTGNIDLDSFSFTYADGFGSGNYTLLASTESIVGTLGSKLTGILNGHEVSLALSGDNTSIILSVGAAIPEPATVALLAGACIFALVTFIRRTSR